MANDDGQGIERGHGDKKKTKTKALVERDK